MSASSVVSRLPLKSLGAGVVLTAALIGASSLPANAQFFNFWGGRSAAPYYNDDRPVYNNGGALPPATIFNIMSRAGYRFESPIQRRGRVYLADVIDPEGRRAHVVIDSFDGSVLQSFGPGGPPAYQEDRPQVARGEPYSSEGADDEPLPGPNVIPGIGPQDVPHFRTPREPPRTAPVTRAAPRTKKSPAVASRTPPNAVPSVVAPAATDQSGAPENGGAAPQSSAKVEAPGANTGPAGSSPPASRPEPKAAASQAASAPLADAAPAEKSRKTTAAPVQPAPAAGGAGQDKPGYANGVPVNPLD